MTHEHAPTTPGRLTEGQKTRIEFARHDLDHARSEDLSKLDAAGLILLVERLRGRLGDMLDLIAERDETAPDRHSHP
ncbi:hypothetical protein [Streptomyces griseorubiginosus]|uniref:hypothetical protein n=1 Tax=Streptomyces griseorubiginosus TaxID=67304 RepID=UPI0036ED7646